MLWSVVKCCGEWWSGVACENMIKKAKWITETEW